MREFKHKITGIKGELLEDGHLHFNRTDDETSCHETIWFGFIENSQDWEEIEQPYWKILSFNRKGRIDTRRENGLFGMSTGNKPQKEGYYNENSYVDYWNIYSIKRLSDGVVFTVGDTVVCNEKYVEKIKSIDFYEKKHLVFNFENTSDNFTTDSEWNRMQLKIEQPLLFTTEDGVEIFDEKIKVAWVINGHYAYNLEVGALHRELVKNEPETYKLFSTKENAEKWLSGNEKKFSLNDIKNILIKEMEYTHWVMTDVDKIIENIKNGK